jgi:hypothetical protein
MSAEEVEEIPVLMLGLGVSVSVVLFAGGFVFWMGMRAAESLMGR